MAEAKFLYYTLGLILLLGFGVPFVLGFFIDLSTIEASGYSAPIIELIEDGFEIDVIPFTDWDNFDVNPFSWLGSTIQDKIAEAFLILGVLPDFITLTLLSLLGLSFILLVISIVRGN